jgi:hypothetical protein
MYNEGWYPGLKSSVIKGCTFRDNVALSVSNGEYQYGGGGMCNYESGPTVDGCTFEGNVVRGTSGVGGGMLNRNGVNNDAPKVVNCVFKGNRASYGGGGVAITGSADILNCTFYRNGRGPHSGGTIGNENGGAIFGYRWGARIVDVIFSGNVAVKGGAICSFPVSSPRSVDITRCLFHENFRAFNEQRDIDHISYSSHAAIETELLFDVDPLLADPENGDFHLLEGSPAIDAGVIRKYAKGSFLPLPDTDFEGDRRIIGGAADIGADEFVPNLTDLGAFLRALADSGEIEPAVAERLLAYVDAAQTALDQDQDQTAKTILNMLVADVRASLGATETAQLIEAKTLAVIEEI